MHEINNLFTIAIIIVIIMVIAYLCYCRFNKMPRNEMYRGRGCLPCQGKPMKKDNDKEKDESAEDAGTKESFTSSDMQDSTNVSPHQRRDGSSMSPDEWQEIITQASLDNKVFENQDEFWKRRKERGMTGTGRVWTPDSHDPEPIVPFYGFSRPEKVPVSENAQIVPDVNTNNYANRKTVISQTGWQTVGSGGC